MLRMEENKKAIIDDNIQEGLTLLQKAVDLFREAHYMGSGMAELLLRRTTLSLFIHDSDRDKSGNRVTAKEFLMRKQK